MPLPHITPDDYLANCKRRFGTANPERIHNPVWEWMVHKGHNPYVARTSLGLEYNVDGPGNPDFCFDRFGAPKVKMPDDRLITIAGEHEDSYDPDFCIYNDVIVQRGGDLWGGVEIYGYPRDVFPPTDFHTATLVGDHIYLIGSLGYQGERQAGQTPVFRLDTTTYRIERVPTSGNNPGWIYRHKAALAAGGRAIDVWDGRVEQGEGAAAFWRNVDVYRLHLADGVWQRLTDHSAWRQFTAQRESDDGFAQSLGWYSGEELATLGYPYRLHEDPEDDEDDDRESPDRPHVIFVDGVPVEIVDLFRDERITFQGHLPQERIDRVLEQIRQAAGELKGSSVRIQEVIRPAGT